MKQVLYVLCACVTTGLTLFTPLAISKDYFNVNLENLAEIDIFGGNVLSAHLHNEGEWMVNYHAVYMDMDGLRNGNNRISNDAVLADPRFKITPTSMDMQMQMQMIHIMYAPTDDLTLMVRLPWIEKQMKHTTITGLHFKTKSTGLGDITFNGNYSLGRMYTDAGFREFILTTGLNFPTGSIQEKDFVRPAGRDQTLPYPMQLGSGTYDPIVGFSYLERVDDIFFGLQGTAKIRIGENDHHYRLGNQYTANTWLNYAWVDFFSTSVRVEADFIGNIHGRDRRITGFVPTADPDLQAHTRVTVFLGGDFYTTDGIFEEFRLGFEIGSPVYQYLDGPQLEMDWSIHVGLQYQW